MNGNEILAQALQNYMYAVQGQPAVYCGPGMICTPVPFVGNSVKNALAPFRFTKAWVEFLAGATGLTLVNSKSIDLLSGGVGSTRADWNVNADGQLTLGISDTNFPKDALADVGYTFFITGFAVSFDQVVTVTGSTETVPVEMRADSGYLAPIAETVLNEGVLVASSELGGESRVMLLSMYPSAFGPRSGNRTVTNGGNSNMSVFSPLVYPIASGDKNTNSKLALTLSYPRARVIGVDAGAPALTDGKRYYAKITVIVYGIQLCMPELSQCGPGAMIMGNQLASGNAGW